MDTEDGKPRKGTRASKGAVETSPTQQVSQAADETVALLLRETGCASVDELRDVARVGHSLMSAIAAHSKDWPLKDWAPADDPAEIVGDLVAMLHEHREKLADATAPHPEPADLLFPAGAAIEGGIAVTVIGPKKGRYRIGRRFDAEPRPIRVTPDELAKLRADRMLSVTVADAG